MQTPGASRSGSNDKGGKKRPAASPPPEAPRTSKRGRKGPMPNLPKGRDPVKVKQSQVPKAARGTLVRYSPNALCSLH